jgi:predicted metalloenzyme YecM
MIEKQDLDKLESKLDDIKDKLHALDIKVVGQDHLNHRVENLERNQRWLITTVLAALVKFIFDFFKGL